VRFLSFVQSPANSKSDGGDKRRADPHRRLGEPSIGRRAPHPASRTAKSGWTAGRRLAIVRARKSLRSFPGENGAPRMLEQIQQFLLHYFTWWNGANFNTRFYTKRFGVLVGHDEFGNTYYRRPGIDPALGFERRWVIYNGVAEASMTPPGWNGWLHHTVDTPPTEEDYKPHPWQLPHMGNPTGTPFAIRPDGSTLRPGPRQPTGGDYEAWSPGP
jgi:NADH:ubiquinone oxidoreductase subunit